MLSLVQQRTFETKYLKITQNAAKHHFKRKIHFSGEWMQAVRLVGQNTLIHT